MCLNPYIILKVSSTLLMTSHWAAASVLLLDTYTAGERRRTKSARFIVTRTSPRRPPLVVTQLAMRSAAKVILTRTTVRHCSLQEETGIRLQTVTGSKRKTNVFYGVALLIMRARPMLSRCVHSREARADPIMP